MRAHPPLKVRSSVKSAAADCRTALRPPLLEKSNTGGWSRGGNANTCDPQTYGSRRIGDHQVALEKQSITGDRPTALSSTKRLLLFVVLKVAGRKSIRHTLPMGRHKCVSITSAISDNQKQNRRANVIRETICEAKRADCNYKTTRRNKK